MVQHLTWYVSVPPDHGTTFDLVCQCTTRPWYNIRPGTSVYHTAMYNIRTGMSVYHLAMVQHSNWYVAVPPSHGTTFNLVCRCTTQL